ncbi:hypothetical protein CGRA01v4_06102 [Colletotrichum graminicola]|nr:hypothetical protein CGRA01v4_06102 [Colletotrichum graminicola]
MMQMVAMVAVCVRPRSIWKLGVLQLALFVNRLVFLRHTWPKGSPETRDWILPQDLIATLRDLDTRTCA